MPESLIVLAVIALVLYIIFTYLLPGPPWPSPNPYSRTMLAGFIIVLVLILWYVLPVTVGHRG